MVELIRILIYASIYLGLVATTFYILSFFAYRKKEKLLYADNELPKVTVLIPAYNEEDSIEKTIRSVAVSKYPKGKLDILVIDDGSKDNTFSNAKKLEKEFSFLKVIHKENGGKGSALNLGISKANAEIIFTMDADTRVENYSLINMTRYFKDPTVYSVTPGMVTEKPKTIWQRVQHVEYLQGLFLRRAFASLNSIYITPGAFSAYRKSFFDEYGGYDVGNITEDLEIALRIQFNGYRIENCLEAPAYTIAPKHFSDLLKQRRRWYYGLIKNMWKYKAMFGKKYGDLGIFVLPIAWISILFSLVIAIYAIGDTLNKVFTEISFYNSIHFNFYSAYDINRFFIERFLFEYFTNPVVIFVLVFMVCLGSYIRYGIRKIGDSSGVIINIPIYFLLFSVLFAIWWTVSIFYAIFAKTIKWK